MFKTRKLLFFVVVMVIISLTSIGLSLFAYFYVGNKVEYNKDEYILEDLMNLGYKFEISDIKTDINYKKNWIDSNVSVKIYIYTDSNNLNKTIESNEVIKYDEDSKKFVVVGIGSGYIEVKDKFDSTISIKFPYKTSFISKDTQKLIEDNGYNFYDDNYISMSEINSLVKLIISDFENYDLIDFNNFSNLQNVYLIDKNNVLDINNKPNCTYFVSSELYSSYLNDNNWKNFQNNIYPYTSDNLNQITALYMFDGGHLDSNFEIESYAVNIDINTKNEKINDIQLSKEGYLFDGWYVYENGDVTNKKIDNDYVYDSNIKLMAKWNEIKYSIRYNSSKQTTLPEGEFLSYKQNSKISDMIPEYEGYTFLGWSLDNDAKNVDFSPLDDISMLTNIDNDVVDLYAVWSANNYNISFDSNGSNDNYSPILNVETDMIVTIPNYKPTKAGYTFIGWDTNKNSIIPQFLADQENKGVNLATGGSDTVVLYAIYIPNNYKVLFDANGGSNAPIPIDCSYGIEETIPNVIPQKDKMVFLGWDEDKNATNPKYKIGNKFKNLTTNESIILYAIYDYDSFTIEYYGDSSVSNLPSNSSSIKYNQSSFLISNVSPTKSGYLFVGWSLSGEINAAVDYKAGYNLDSSDIKELYDLSTNNVVTLYSVFKKIYEFKLYYYSADDYGANVYFAYDVTDSYGVIHKKDEYVKYNEDGKTYYFDEGTTIRLRAKFTGDGDKKYIIDGGNEQSSDTEEIYLDFKFYSNHTLKIDSWGACIVNGTLIMMADGSNKKIEDILPTDKILSFNHNTGEVEMAFGFMIERSSLNLLNTKTLTLYFENNTQITIVDCHRFFDTTLMKYVEIDYNNVLDYINHNFLTIKNIENNYIYEEVKLLNVEFKQEDVYVYSPLSYININIITNNILSAPGGNLEGLFNYFEIGDGYKYDTDKMQEDISNYGLFTYEEFYNQLPDEIKEFMTEELFEFFNGSYFKIVIGKDIMSFEEIVKMIADYRTQLMEI